MCEAWKPLRRSIMRGVGDEHPKTHSLSKDVTSLGDTLAAEPW